MKDRVAGIADLFLVVIDKENGKMAGFLNGLATVSYTHLTLPTNSRV